MEEVISASSTGSDDEQPCDRTGLTRLSTANNLGENIELAEHVDELEGLLEQHHRGRTTEVVVNGLTVDNDHARAGLEGDASGCGLAAANGAP